MFLKRRSDIIKTILRTINVGDTIGLIAPAGYIKTKEEVYRFVNIINHYGYKVKLGKHLFCRVGYLAGSDIDRASDVMDMFLDHEVSCIFCFKGGYGCQRILPYLDYSLITNNPKLFVGFSDITVLLNVLFQKCGIPTLHGNMGVVLNKYPLEESKQLFDILNKGFINPLSNTLSTFKYMNKRDAEGVLVGGNLSLIVALLGTPYEINMKDKILFIEDVDEQVYTIDRMLSTLKLSGKLEQLKGIIIGTFTDIMQDENQSISDIFKTYFSNLNIPVILNFECGHSLPFINLPIGLKVRIDSANDSVIVLDSYHFDK